MDGRQDRDECAKPTIGRASNLSDGIVAVFSLVRFQEKEVRKALKKENKLVAYQDGEGAFPVTEKEIKNGLRVSTR